MDSTQHEISAANDELYGAEVLCAGWNPLVAAVAEPVAAARGLIAELAGVDSDTFLARVYQFQQV